ncbi:MAG: lactonase family protein [Trinickia sp.]|uniref:lactonase family protein n=1 Tax=Trinickia sp. TaxID=2571163 RepID=UPI003F80A49B
MSNVVHASPWGARSRSSGARGWLAGFLFAWTLGAATASAQDAPTAQAGGSIQPGPIYDLLIGTYTHGTSRGIDVYRFDSATGQVSPVSSVQTVNPSYLVVTPDARYVYAVNELPGDTGPASERGGISAFAFDPRAGQLTFLDRVSSEGNDPCYLAFSPDGRYLLTANYSVAADPGGSFAVFPLQEDGHVGAAVLVVHHEGGGPVKGRQDNAHVHSTVFTPDGHYLFTQDLGNDKLYEYRYTNDGSRGLLSPVPEGYVQMPAGSGPRHLVFAPNGRDAYLTSELAGTVTTLRYADGKLAPLQVLPLAARGFAGKIGAGAIHLSPDGKFLYATNRGDANEIVIFAVDAQDGSLKLVGRQSTLGRTPREFAIDPTGRWLIVGNQDSDSAYVFRRDPVTGLLADPTRLSIGSPVDFKFTPSS